MAREPRRLAAILAADVVGYSRLMGRDESGTLARLREHRKQRFEPALARHGGRLVKLTGDGALTEFGSAVDALSAAIEFQQLMAEVNRTEPDDTAIVFRIGLHLGDLIVDGDDLYGDGVNIAARLEGEAAPGGIVISANVHDAVAGRLKANFADFGNLALKNIERPIHAFRVQWEPADWQTSPGPDVEPSGASEGTSDVPLTIPDKPSIAVLPFQNMSGDPEQEYFADGVVEDIITALSRFRPLFVIARNASFSYKGRAIDIRAVGRELAARYVLEGSVRRFGNRVRITGQLIESQSLANIWADRFEGSIDDVFALQDQVAASVVGALVPKLDQAEIERAKRKPVENLGAYDWFLRGMAKAYQQGYPAWRDALGMFQRAIDLDPDFAPPYALATRYYSVKKFSGRANREADEAEVRRLASRVAVLGMADPLALCWAGHSLLIVCGDHDQAMAMVRDAALLNPNLAAVWQTLGSVSMYCGEHESAISQLNRALQFSPVGPDAFHIEQTMSAAYLFLGRYKDSLHWANRAVAHSPTALLALELVATSLAMIGELERAKDAASKVMALYPTMTVSKLAEMHSMKRAVDMERALVALRLAGFPM
jgi:TolB-like protein/class 3 adenylate cyclase